MTLERLRSMDVRARALAAGVLLALLLAVGIGAYCSASGGDDDDRVAEDQEPVTDFVDNLERRVAAGDWTLEEGLVQTLRMFAGQADLADILEGRDLLASEGTGIVAMASDYQDSGPDGGTREEIGRLLDAIFMSQEELDASSAPLPASRMAPGVAPLVLNPVTGPAPRRAAETVLPAPFDCDADPCFLFAEKQFGQAVFRVYLPAVYATGPEQQLVDLVLESLDDTVPAFSTYLPFTFSTNIVFATEYKPEYLAVVWKPEADNVCPMTVYIPTVLPNQTEEMFRKTISHELFHCYQQWNFPQASEVDYACARWWVEGSAEYLSNVVYRSVNDEWEFWKGWVTEKGEPVTRRAYDNAMLFQFLANRLSDDGVIELIRTLPKSGKATPSADACLSGQRAALAAFPNMSELFHDFGKEFLGPGIVDTDGTVVLLDYDPDEIVVDSSPTIFTRSVGAMVLDWYTAVLTTADKQYVLTQEAAGAGKASAGRPTAPNWAGPFPQSITSCPSNRLTVVLTATQPGYQHTLTIAEDTGAEDPCEPPDEPEPGGFYPPLPEPASSFGEPHIQTFDQLNYDFQAVGEFILAKSTEDDLEIQVRQQPVPGSDSVSVNGALAFNVNGDRVGVHATLSEPLVVNGQASELPSGELALPNGGTITGSEDSLLVTWPDGTEARLEIGSFFMNVAVALAADRAGNMTGLLGNANGDPEDDITTRDGDVLDADPSAELLPVSFRDMYQVYGRSWRISQQESLFDYAPGETTATFTDEDFPATPVDIRGFSDGQRQEAEDDCREAGVLDVEILEGCIFDVLVTGEIEFALLAARVDQSERISDTAGRSFNPRVAFDGAGNLHVIWTDDTDVPSAGDVLHRYRDSTGQWSAVEKLSASVSGDFSIGSSALLTKPDGTVCAFWSGGFKSAPYGLYRRCFENGTWTPAQLVTEGTFTALFYPAFDALGNARAVRHVPPSGILFGDSDLSPGGMVDSVRFAITTDGTYHLLWQALPDFTDVLARPVIQYIKSKDGGDTWSQPETVIDDSAGLSVGTLAADAAGGLTLAITQDNQAGFLRYTSAAGWGNPQRAAELCCSYYIAIDEDGQAHLASIDNVAVAGEQVGRLGYAARGDDTWEPWRAAYLTTEIDAGVGAIAVDAGGGAHVVLGLGGDLYYLRAR